MYCQSCGKENADGASFCNGCGKPLGGNVNNAAPLNTTEKKKLVDSKRNYYGLFAGIAALLSVFLPFVSANFLGAKVSRSIIDSGDAIIYIALAAIAIVFALLGKNIIIIISGFLLLIMLAIENSALANDPNGGTWDELAKALIQREIGFYLLLIGSVGLIVSGIVGIVVKRKEKKKLRG